MTAIGNTFRSDPLELRDLLEKVHSGDIQLPDFQRDWIWSDGDIRSLIASVSMSYPVGSVILLETGSDEVRFRSRVIEGAPDNENSKPRHLILDGQQRITSLYLALRSGGSVHTRDEKRRKTELVYYLDIAKCLDPDADRESAVVSLPPTRLLMRNFGRDIELDISTNQKEYEEGFFPLRLLFNDVEFSKWTHGYYEYHKSTDGQFSIFENFRQSVIDRFRIYRVPSIELTRETQKEAICQVFEKVNTGGVKLTVFELMTATYAADEFNLRSDWEKRNNRIGKIPVIAWNGRTSVDSTAFLQAVTLLVSYRQKGADGRGVSCKRKDILNLHCKEYQKNADLIEQGFYDAASLLMDEKIFNVANLPYDTQFIPLAATCAYLGKKFHSDTVKRKLVRWYWCGVFGEIYGGGSLETRFANDIVDLIAWIENDSKIPRTVKEANLAPTRLLTLKSRVSAAYKGLMARLMQVGSADFISARSIENTMFFDEAVDIHHIFPRAYCSCKGYPSVQYESIVNKTPLTARTNRIIGGRAPSKYSAIIENRYDVKSSRLDEILSTHSINPILLRNDNFGEFICDRASRLLDLVEQSTGKAVDGRDSEQVIKEFGGPVVSNVSTAYAKEGISGTPERGVISIPSKVT